MEKNLEKIVKELLNHLEIKPDSIEVKKEAEETYLVNLKVSEDDTGILIGFHGDTISALQLLLSLMLYKNQEGWARVIVNIGDYRQKREESLKEMAQDTVEKVLENKEPIALFNLNPFERRVVHLYLSKNSNVVSESQGEGKNRHLIISPAPLKNPNESKPLDEK